MIWLQYFMFFIAFQALFIAVIILGIIPSKRKILNLLFSLLLIFISLYILSNSIPRFPVDYPRLYMFSNIFIYTYTPIFYLLLNALFDNNFKIEKKHLVYIFPIILYTIFLFRYLLMPGSLIIERLKSGHLTDLYVIDLSTFCFNIYIIYRSWKLFNENKLQLESFKKSTIVGFACFILLNNFLWIGGVLLHLNIGLEMNSVYHSAHWISTSFLLFFLFMLFIVRSSFFKEYMLIKSSDYLLMNNLRPDEIESVIISIMKERKPYLDSEFSLTELSNLTGIKKYQLSRFINFFMKTTFFELINSYRLDEFLNLINSEEHKNMSIIGIAYESGFKSKSTFFKVFKETIGQSPKEYLKNIKSPYYNPE
jgi:AraC-like DNA-binding protein